MWFIDEHRDRFTIEFILYDVEEQSRRWLHHLAWLPAVESPGVKCPRCSRPKPFLEHVRSVHADSYGVYGVRKMWHALFREGIAIGREQIARLMRLAGHGITASTGTVGGSYDNALATARQPRLNQNCGAVNRPEK